MLTTRVTRIHSFACPLPTNRMRILKVVYLFIYLATMSEAQTVWRRMEELTSERTGKDMDANCHRLLDAPSLHEHHD
jgi:hypothetical protein